MYIGTFDLYSTALEICYMIATRILKIDVGTRHLEIDIMLLHRGRKIIYVKGGNFDLNYLSYF